MKKYIYFFSIIFIFYGCPTYDPAMKPVLHIYNFSDEAIYIYYTKDESIKVNPKLNLFQYRGNLTDEYGNKLDSLGCPEYRINPHGFSFFIGKRKWCPFPDVDYVNFFFIKEKTMKDYTWEQIANKQIYEKKVKYTYKELEKMHYKIFYKP